MNKTHRESQLKGRLRLRHLLETTEAVAEEMELERERFELLKDETLKPRVVSSFNLFQTPVELADHLVTLVPLEGRILEPSAGLGRLYRAIRCRSNSHVTLVDISPDCCRELYLETQFDDQVKLINADFLECDQDRLGGLFDVILMNPPFKNATDIRHISHARSLLAPGGRLVSLCANGPRQRKCFANEDYTPLPPKSFASEGTYVESAIVVING